MIEGTIEAAIWRPGAASYVLRIDDTDSRFPAIDDLDTTRYYYPSELIDILAAAIAYAGPSSVAPSIDTATGVLTLTMSSSIIIQWTHGNTTLPYSFGFDTESDTDDLATLVADFPMPGFWIPGKSAESDPVDFVDVVFGTAESLSGIGRTQRFSNARRKRNLDYRLLTPDQVLLSAATVPHTAFEYVWINALTHGRTFRVYDAGDGYREYTIRPGTANPPYARNGIRAFYWDVSMLLRRTDAESVGGVDPDPGGDPPNIESFTVNSGTSISVRGAVDTLDFAWTVVGADDLEIDQGIGTVTGSSETGVASVEGVTVYTLTATNGNGESTAQVTVTGVRQVLTRYGAAYRSMWGSDLSGTDWPYREGGFDLCIARGSNATGGQSTSGLTSLALPAALVNQGVRPSDPTSSSTQGYSDSTTSGNGNQHPATAWRARYLMQPKSLTNARYLCQMFRSANDYYNVQWLSSGPYVRLSGARNGTSMTIDMPAGGFVDDAWCLLDIVFDQNGGTSGEARVIMRVNGVETHNTASGSTGAFTGFSDTQTLFGLFGSRTGLLTQDGIYVAWQVFSLTAYTAFSLADHQADAQALGLYTPP